MQMAFIPGMSRGGRICRRRTRIVPQVRTRRRKPIDFPPPRARPKDTNGAELRDSETLTGACAGLMTALVFFAICAALSFAISSLISAYRTPEQAAPAHATASSHTRGTRGWWRCGWLRACVQETNLHREDARTVTELPQVRLAARKAAGGALEHTDVLLGGHRRGVRLKQSS